ncbi:hypothetical protein CARUB_v10025407mg [Capsella rubella]|uniref:DUF1985 domain-containing protein n=1 Tax=Capsella rubella TaxID=81985 RepID=R0HYI1_9BRAS|nr:hypothetical protein CARUB_v10025407mg [Capsella rubella]
MAKDANHKLMGMWMLFLLTAYLEKKEECWFLVNCIPIRYSLREMMKRASTTRVKMAVLHILCSVLIGKKKTMKQAPSVEPFFLRAVDDLDMCKTFPWGRLAFDENMKDIFHCMNHFSGVLRTQQHVFPSFVIPLENVLVMHMHTVIVLRCAR